MLAEMRAGRGRFYYGWAVVGALALAITSGYGILTYAFTVFVEPMHAELGWTVGQLTGAVSLAGIASVVLSPILGRLLDRHGSRLVMSLGTVAAALLLLAWSAVSRIEVFYVTIFLLTGASVAVLYPPAFWTISNWFAKKRRRALTVLTFTGGFAAIIFTPLTQLLITSYGWRTTLVIYAVFLLCFNLPLLSIILRRRPEDLGLAVDGGAPGDVAARQSSTATRRPGATLAIAMQQAGFWWLTAAFALNSIAIMFVLIHFVPLLIERGYAPAVAAAMYGLIGLASLPGRLVLTPLGERIPPGWISVAIFLTQTVGFAVLALGRGSWTVILFLILIAAGFGAISPSNAALIADLFGVGYFGTIQGVIGMVIDGSTAVILVLLAALRDYWGGYAQLTWVVMAIAALSAACMLVAWARRQIRWE
ncbi:MAG: MFS transporter [Anaerolineales bacterium]